MSAPNLTEAIESLAKMADDWRDKCKCTCSACHDLAEKLPTLREVMHADSVLQRAALKDVRDEVALKEGGK